MIVKITVICLNFMLYAFAKNMIKVGKKIDSSDSNRMVGKIVHGQPVKLERFPFSAQFFNNGNMCGGSILSTWAVLTAGHCFDVSKNIKDMNICVGATYIMDYDGDLYGVLDFYIHPDYNKTVMFANDIAIIVTNRHIQLGEKVQRALLVTNDKWLNEKNYIFEAIGWGRTEYNGPVSEKGLLMTKLKIVSLKRCMQLHQSLFTEDMFCLYGDGESDVCQGDSGSGVSWRGALVGIVSHGEGCALKMKPSVYANLWYFRDWIKHAMGRLQYKTCDFVDSSSES